MWMDDRLFDQPDDAEVTRDVPAAEAPLAVRMRPRSLDELVGQGHLLAEGSALRTAVETREPHSAILYGPPGAGKTTLARIIASTSDAAFEEESAVNAGKAQVTAVIERARERRKSERRTVLFLDEIHRFNKAQQDALLPAVEEGLVTLIGATTENPYFEVNGALLSRCQIYELRELSAGDVEDLLRRALGDPERGIADPPEVDDDALELLAHRSGGDARAALGALDRGVETARAGEGKIDLALAEDALQRKAIAYDRQGDKHFDYISAWIKATRGSDPDASIYYLAVMLEGGEDPRFIARRMVIFASEDIGNADPQALAVATAAGAAVDRVGLPECALNLAQAAAYLALAPKSNAATAAIGAASRNVRENGAKLPPDALRSGGYPGAKELGRGQGYQYPHSDPDGISRESLLPAEVRGARFYEPTGRGYEKRLAERLAELRRLRGDAP